MNTLADTIVYLLAYLSLAGKDPEDGHTLDCNRADDDCKAMEIVAAMLDSATAAERSALRTAIERAVAREHASGGPRYDWLACYDEILTTLNEGAASTDTDPT